MRAHIGESENDRGMLWIHVSNAEYQCSVALKSL